MEIYNEKINKRTDWGGDISTGFLPVSGRRVQEFIKEELSSKVGAFYKPEGSTLVYTFADEADKQSYIDTGDESLVLDVFETVSKYNVIVNQDTLVLSHSVIDGSTGNTVEFEFKIVDDNGMSSDASARIEFSFTGSGISNKFSMEKPVTAGGWTSVRENIDKYLRTGSNSISIKITGLSTQTTVQFVMTYNLFDLKFTPDFEYNTVKTGNTITVPYIIECSDTKYLEFYIDGERVHSSESETITDIRKDGTATLNISNLEIGQHSLQVRAYVRSTDGTQFYTPLHYYTFAKDGETVPSFLLYKELPNNASLTTSGQHLKITGNQFEEISFNWSLYDYFKRRLTVYFQFNGVIVGSTVVTTNGTINLFTYRPMDFGTNLTLHIFAYNEDNTILFDDIILVDVVEAVGGIKETKDGLLLKLQATGRRNSDENRDIWSCVGSDGETYAATFNGFAWNTQQGWNAEHEALVISNGATVDFNIRPMYNDWAINGGTFEIDLETFDIDNDNAVICECADELNTSMFRITATKAEISTNQGISINTRYKDNEKLKIAFICNRSGNFDEGNLMYIVVNGVLERAAIYRDSDTVRSLGYLRLGDPNGECKVRVKSIRIYNRAISVDEAFNNYVVDSPNVQLIYDKNNVLAPGSTEVGFDEVANKIPVMIFTGDMNELRENGQDKEWRNFDVEYVNRQHPEFNFVSFNCRLKLQGTSSLGYPRKNFKLSTKDKNFNAEVYANSNYELDPDSTVGNKMLRNKRTLERIDFDDFRNGGTLHNTSCFTLDSDGKALKKGKYKFKKGAHKADKWTLKADFMESSCSHNVGAGRSWNDIFENTELLANGDASYTNNTYQDSALVNSNPYISYTRADGVQCFIENNTQAIKDQKKYVCRTDAQKICIANLENDVDDIRTAIDGFPMVCFYRTSHMSNDLVFMGQYNFINDKGSYEVFGFEDIEDPDDETRVLYDADKVECWEGLKNTNPLSLFKTTDGFYDMTVDGKMRKWEETYESRYPDPDDYGVAGKKQYDPTALYELSQWIVSTRHESDNIASIDSSNTITIDSTFAEKINSYQYGYTTDTAESYRYDSGVVSDTPENRQKKFNTEKWEHFDVWKLAGYYIFLMRYGAVDQFVKNTMLFTDGNGKYDERTDKKYRKWFFINYDNDCLFGLRNNGQLAFDWTLNRQTIDAASDIEHDDQMDDDDQNNAYAMMGHDSTLWNNLERDDEFMRMVRDLDYSMSKYKLNYDNMVTEFDTNQTEQWCERIYNANERYKYINAAKGIGDMSGSPVNNLWMLQGTRRSHRHWWIANHFNLLDAQWLSGDYKNTYVEIKTNCKAGTAIHATASMKYYYAWGQQKKIYESNMVRNEGEAIDFVFDTDQSQGDPVYIYAFNKFSEMDFSEIAPLAYEGCFKFVLGNNLVANSLKKLVLGNSGVTNNMAQDTTTWINIPNLEYLDITNWAGITSVPLEAFKNLTTFKAGGSRIGSFEPSEGSNFEKVILPNTIRYMKLNNVKFGGNINQNLQYTPNTTLDTLIIDNNDGVGVEYYNKLIQPWITTIENSSQSDLLYANKSMSIHNINWSFNNLNAIRIFRNFKDKGALFDMTGTIDLRYCGNLSMANIEELRYIFGENCFNPVTAKLYVLTPESIFIQSDGDNMVAGQTMEFRRQIYPDEGSVEGKVQSLRFMLVKETDEDKSENPDVIEDQISQKRYLELTPVEINGLRNGLALTNGYDGDGKEIAILSVPEQVTYTDTECIVMVKMDMVGSDPKVAVMNFTIKDPTYASTIKLDGQPSQYHESEYIYTLDLKTSSGFDPIGTYEVIWSLTGSGVQYVVNNGMVPGNKSKYFITIGSNQPEVSDEMQLSVTVNNTNGTTLATSLNILVLNEDVIMTSQSNPYVLGKLNAAGWTSGPSATAMKKVEAEAITPEMFAEAKPFYNQKPSTGFTFNELKYFTGLTTLPDSAFAGSYITQVSLPLTTTGLGVSCFESCTRLAKITEDGVTDYMEDDIPFNVIHSGITTIPQSCFKGCTALNDLTLTNVNTIDNFAFGNTGFREVRFRTDERGTNVLRLSENLELIKQNAFETTGWKPDTTNNKIEVLSLPQNTRLETNYILYGKNYRYFVTHEDNLRYKAVDGILWTADETMLLRYPPKMQTTTSINLPYIQNIGNYAFFYTQYVDDLTINFTLSLGEGTFRDSKFKEIDLSQCSAIALIPMQCFFGCNLLETLLLPDFGVLKEIGIGAFQNCTVLQEINIPSSVEKLTYGNNGSSTFAGCASLTHIELPQNMNVMGSGAFDGCTSLETLVLPGMVSGLTSQSNIITNCPNLTTLTMPIFSYTTNKKYIVYDDNDELVGEFVNIEDANAAMNEGYRMEETGDNVVLNEYIKAATGSTAQGGGYMITGTPNLLNIYCNPVDNNQIIQEYDGNLYRYETELIRVAYAKTELNLKSGVTEYVEYAFDGCHNLTSIVVGDDITLLGTRVFSNCTSITNAVIGTGITMVPNDCFYGCTYLEKITFLGDVATVGSAAFAACPRLEEISFNSVVSPTLYTFYYSSFITTSFGTTGRLAPTNPKTGTLTMGSYIYVPYNATGYSSDPWPMLCANTDSGYNMTIETKVLNGDYNFHIYQDGVENIDPSAVFYVQSESGDLSYDNGTATANTMFNSDLSAHTLVINNNVYNGEELTFYTDYACTESVGSVTIWNITDEYTIGNRNLSRGVKSQDLKLGQTNETMEISVSDYMTIMSKLNFVMEKIKNDKK